VVSALRQVGSTDLQAALTGLDPHLPTTAVLFELDRPRLAASSGSGLCIMAVLLSIGRLKSNWFPDMPTLAAKDGVAWRA
jgi:hypothetical protein